MKRYFVFDDKETLTKWLDNILKFTAPALAVFFAQLATGVNWKPALLVALLAFYGLLADALKKINEESKG
jgi:hypothetical protein